MKTNVDSISFGFFFTLTIDFNVIYKRVFFLLIYVYWPVEYEFDVHFCRPEPENFDNPKKNEIFSGLSGVFGAGRQKWTLDLDSIGLIKNE